MKKKIAALKTQGIVPSGIRFFLFTDTIMFSPVRCICEHGVGVESIRSRP